MHGELERKAERLEADQQREGSPASQPVADRGSRDRDAEHSTDTIIVTNGSGGLPARGNRRSANDTPLTNASHTSAPITNRRCSLDASAGGSPAATALDRTSHAAASTMTTARPQKHACRNGEPGRMRMSTAC